jgi:hypothetical protein
VESGRLRENLISGFRFPVPCIAALDLRARVVSVIGPLYYVKAELLYEQKVMARAKAKFMEIGIDGSST